MKLSNELSISLLIALLIHPIIVVVFLNSTHESTDSALQKAPSQKIRFEYPNTLPTELSKEEKSAPIEPKTVISSFYGGEKHGDSHGKIMANGERFDKNDPTIAAANDLPFGTKIHVINVQNGKSAVLIVKDRGGFEKYGRKLDVSRAAAHKLGFIEEGLAVLRMNIISFPPRA